MIVVNALSKKVIRKILPKESSGIRYYFGPYNLPMILPAKRHRAVPAFMDLLGLLDFHRESRGVEKRTIVIGVAIGELL